MLDAGVVVATIAIVMVVWNIGLARHVLKQWPASRPDSEAWTPSNEEDDPPRYESLAELLRRAKRKEHFAGLPPGALTPSPWRSAVYGPGRPLVRSISGGDSSHSGRHRLSSSQPSFMGW